MKPPSPKLSTNGTFYDVLIETSLLYKMHAYGRNNDDLNNRDLGWTKLYFESFDHLYFIRGIREYYNG